MLCGEHFIWMQCEDSLLSKAGQAHAGSAMVTWEEEEVEYSVVEEITSLYEVGEWLYIIYDQYGNKVDANNIGRHWAVNGDVSP